MADALLLLVCRYLRDLLALPESQIVAGRANAPRGELDSDLLVVDNLGADRALSSAADYDGEEEVLTLSERASRTVTVDFYGPGANLQVYQFRRASRSQAAQDLQWALGITVWHASGVTDIRSLTGAQRGDRLQIEMKVHYSPSETVETLRIDTANVEVLTEAGSVEIETEE